MIFSHKNDVCKVNKNTKQCLLIEDLRDKQKQIAEKDEQLRLNNNGLLRLEGMFYRVVGSSPESPSLCYRFPEIIHAYKCFSLEDKKFLIDALSQNIILEKEILELKIDIQTLKMQLGIR